MAFETNLSAKDKKTIAGVLGAAAVFAFSWFAIRPVITDIGSLSEDIIQAQQIKEQYKSKIMSLSSAESVFGKAVADLGESTSEYYPVMRSSDIDRMMTSYVLGFGLYPEDFYITMPEGPVVEAPYIYSDIQSASTTPAPTATPTPIAVNTDTSSSTADASLNGSTPALNSALQVESLTVPYNRARDNASSTAYSGIQCVELTYVVVGTPEACQALIDDLSVKPSMRLTGFEWSELDQIQIEQEDGTTEFVDNDNVRLRVEFNLYMTDVTDYDALVSDAVDNAGTQED